MLAKFSATMKQRPHDEFLDRTFSDRKTLGDFPVGASVNTMQEKGFSAAGGQAVDRVPEDLHPLLVEQDPFCGRSFGRRLGREIRPVAARPFEFSSAKIVDREVRRGSKQQGTGMSDGKGLIAVDEAQVSFLHQIRCGLLASHDADKRPQQLMPMLMVELLNVLPRRVHTTKKPTQCVEAWALTCTALAARNYDCETDLRRSYYKGGFGSVHPQVQKLIVAIGVC